MFKHKLNETLDGIYVVLQAETTYQGMRFFSSLSLLTVAFDMSPVSIVQAQWDIVDEALLSYIGWL